MIGRILPSIVLTLVVAACGRTATTSDASPFDRLLRAALDDKRVPGVVAMVGTREGVVYEGAVGVPRDAIFAIASMTKPVTSVAVMQLVEAGRIRLDEPAQTYLPELRGVQVLDAGTLRPPKSPPTVRQLLTHPLHMRQPDGVFLTLPEVPPTPPKFFSGGGGLYSTAADYLRFTRAILAGGELDGRRILRSETVSMMGEHQIGELPLSEIESLDPRLVAPETVLPGGIDGFGLGFALNRHPLESGRAAGAMSWAGVYNTFFWIDRQQGIAAVLLSQLLPFGDGGAAQLTEDFDRLVYQMLR